MIFAINGNDKRNDDRRMTSCSATRLLLISLIAKIEINIFDTNGSENRNGDR